VVVTIQKVHVVLAQVALMAPQQIVLQWAAHTKAILFHAQQTHADHLQHVTQTSMAMAL
jgi:hypothetical protein